MTLDIAAIVQKQITASSEMEIRMADDWRTTITPAVAVCALDEPTLRLSLDGEWRVKRWPFRSEKALVAPRAADAKWERVLQPGKVFYADAEKCPASIPNWNRITQEHIHPEDGAIMRKTARLPAAWRGKRIFLCFDAIYPAGRVYLNGILLGAQTSGLTPAAWDVTALAPAGQPATVAVRLLRWHRFIKLDMPRHGLEFAGLAQSAYFYAVEPCHIAGFHLPASMDAALRQGTIKGKVRVRNCSARAKRGTMELRLCDSQGRQKAKASARFALAANAEAELPLHLTLRQPALWNDEYPRLYRASLCLRAAGQRAQTISWRVGFRHLALAGGRPTLNGRPVKFRGVNHLTFHPEHGLYTPEPWLRRNLELMKKANVNCIRTHYLGPRCLANLCDEIGIYLVQELPIDWGTDYIHDPAWVGPALHRIHAGILRDRHHPSVMIWSIGNENMPRDASVSDAGYEHLRLYHHLAKALDPERPTMFPPPGPANKIRGIFEVRVGDIADTHYSFNLVKEFLRTGRVTNPRAWTAETETLTREEALRRGWSGVWFSSEYGIMNMMPDLLNAPYCSVIDDVPEDPLSGKNSLQVFIDRLRREWGFLRSEPSCLGGAYFPWLCAGAGRNPWGWVLWAEDNDWGVVTADLLPKPYFWALRVLFSPVWFPERVAWQKGTKEIRFRVVNHFNAIDLKDCTLRTQMGGSGGWMGCLRDWRDVSVSCPPGEEREIAIPIWNEGSLRCLEKGETICCRCTLLAPDGFRVITADILVAAAAAGRSGDSAILIGPDAELR
ncbi:MAG: hypothetical protein N3A66_03595 [Planctomycetota bacterium]|nr:hypothetical protein [Planctomycetota bacterium]